MTQSRTPPTKPSIPVPRRAPTDSTPPPEDIPQGEFIDVVSQKPVEPARLQVFPVPEEFLNKVHASKSVQRTNAVKDTVPRGLPKLRNSAPLPLSATAPIESPEPERAGASSAAATCPARSNTGARRDCARGRAPSVLTRWALTGRVPKQVKLALGMVVGTLLVVLLWQNWDTADADADDFKDDDVVTSSAVPLLDAPTREPTAARVAEAPKAMLSTPHAAMSVSIAAPEETGTLSQPQSTAVMAKPNSSAVPNSPRAPVAQAAAPQKRPSNANTRERSTASTASIQPTLTPLFVPR